MSPEVWITRKPRKYVRRSMLTKRHVCKDLSHARNLARKIIKEEAHLDLKTIQVWTGETERYVWRQGAGWTGPEQSSKREDWLIRTGRKSR